MEANGDERENTPEVVMLRPDENDTAVVNPCDACPTFELVQNLRTQLQKSLLQPKRDLHHACTIIAAEPSKSVDQVSAAFFHGLGRHAKRRMVFFNTRAMGISSGERWLARLLEVLSKGDEASARYLMESAIEPAGRRWMLFLARELAAHLMTPGREGPQACVLECNTEEHEQ